MIDFSQLPDVREVHPDITDSAELEMLAHQRAREMALQRIFGLSHPGAQILSPKDPGLKQKWPGGGVFQFPPNSRRPTWHYVTSGLSQPGVEGTQSGQGESSQGESAADSDEKYSGMGIELVISTAEESEWVPGVLLNLVKYLLFQPESCLILPGDRLPIGAPIVWGTDTKLTHFVATTSGEYESEILLPAGRCDLVHLVGITQDENDYAETLDDSMEGSIILCRVLRTTGVGTMTIPERECLTYDRSFEDLWRRERLEYDQIVNS